MASNTEPASPVSLEQLIGLNDEILSIVRAGIPLELGLKEAGRDERGAIGDISLRLALRMSRGESLIDALSAKGEQFPRVYRAVVEAGLRAGRLPAALEAVSRFGRDLLDLRYRIGMALLYPLIVLSVAYGIFLVFVTALVDRFHDTYAGFHLAIHGVLALLIQMRATVAYWAWILPAVLLFLIVWWLLTRGSANLNLSGLTSPLDWMPGVRRLAMNFCWANFSDLLALLVEQSVPLPEGIVLAADATSPPSVQTTARHLATALATGQTWQRSGEFSEIPPYLRWVIVHGQAQGEFAPALRQAAELYRRRASNQLAWFRLGFPILAGVVIGGGATFFYAMTLFLPLIGFMEDIARP